MSSLTEDLTNGISGTDAKNWAKKLVNQPALIEELFSCVFSSVDRLNRRATWVLQHSHDLDHSVIAGKEISLLNMLSDDTYSDGTIRSVLKIFESHDIPEEMSSSVLDICYSFLKNPSKAIAVRVFSMTLIFNISRPYPDLLSELKMVINELLLQEDAPAIKARGRNILKQIGKLMDSK